MPVLELERVIATLAPASVVGETAVEVRDLAHDARAVTPGALFFCVPGRRVDGHDFAADAVGRGAVALVVERLGDEDAQNDEQEVAVVFRNLRISAVEGAPEDRRPTYRRP